MLWRNKERNQLYIGLEGVSWIVKTMTFFVGIGQVGTF